MAKSPLNDQQYICTSSILSSGSAIVENYMIFGINIHQPSGSEDIATITLAITELYGDASEPTVPKDFELDKPITIGLGYEAKNTTVFKGKVVQQRMILLESGNQFNWEIRCESGAANPPYLAFDILNPKEAVLEVQLGYDIIDATLKHHISQPSHVQGRVTFQGSADARVNDAFILKGLGTTFSRTETISAVTHEVTGGQWTTTVQLGHDN